TVRVPAGRFGGRPASSLQEVAATRAVKGALDNAEEFGRIVLRANGDGSAVHRSDVARVAVGSQDYSFESRLTGQRAVAGAVQLSPGANAIQTARAVAQPRTELSVNFPEGVGSSIPYDTSRFADVAIAKVIYTLLEAMTLVALGMFLVSHTVR
ncbi:multidrug efflux RND transporter permease subunit, partial [Pseudomonas syringae]